MAEKVIVIDSESDEEAQNDTSQAAAVQEAPDPGKTKPSSPEKTAEETVDYLELIKLLETGMDVDSSSNSRSKGPVCCNTWCFEPASIVPGKNIRDYYGIPSGKSHRLCSNCSKAYYTYLETAEKNLKSGGDMLEGCNLRTNEFVILEDEPEEESEVCDPALEKLLSNASLECFKEFDKEFNLGAVLGRSQKTMEENLEQFITNGEELLKEITEMDDELYQTFCKFKKEFAPAMVTLAPLEIPVDEADFGNVEGQLYFTEPKLKSLAPREHVYSPKLDGSLEWCLVEIIKLTPNSAGTETEFFTIQSLGAPRQTSEVREDQLAYSSPPTSTLGVGTRIIAGVSEGGQQKKFYPGMIAELPTPANRSRYMVFFDNGRTLYCTQKDVRLVCKITKPLEKYLTGFFPGFIQVYLHKFPERTMLKTSNQHFVRVELNGDWISCKVLQVDASLVQVLFREKNRTEWIYRGSPRLRPIYSYDRMKAMATNKTKIPEIRPVTRQDLTKKQSVPQMVVIDSSDEDEPNKPNEVRAVARKSTSRPPPSVVMQGPRRFERATRVSVMRKYPTMLNPNSFHYHKCSRSCVTWVNYSEEKTAGFCPLAIPSIFAFKREVDVTSAVSYVAPCGKRLKIIQEVLKYLSETLIPLTLDMFDFDIRTQIFDEFYVAPQYVLIEDISNGAERNPIPCINDLDYDLPDLMNYMTVRRPLQGVNINLDPGFLVCCDCKDNCRDRSKCRCWRLTIDCYKPFNVGEQKRNITKIGYNYQRLDQNLLSGVYECNSNCHCNKVTCINRVVQHPLRHKLQLFKTMKKGWGTRVVNDIPQGTFICTYVGNIMTEPSANETGTINGDEYFAELDHIEVMQSSKKDYEEEAQEMSDNFEESDEEKEHIPVSRRALRSLRSTSQKPPEPPKRRKPTTTVRADSSDSDSDMEDSVRRFYGPHETVYVMDAKIAGNIGRYFNHSCDPNMFVQNVYIDTHDLRFPWVAFFALKHIPAGTELTWDYNYKIGTVPGKVLYCYCGSYNCRKRLL